MRHRSYAYVLVVLVAVAALPAAAVAAFAPWWAGAGAFAALVVLELLLVPSWPRRHSLELRLKSAPAHAGGAEERRVLVVANDTLDEGELIEEVERLASEPGTSVELLVPALVSGLARWTSALDAGDRQARTRLAAALGRLRPELQVTGHVSDAPPLTAVEDALVAFPADQIVVATRVERPWQGVEPQLAGLVRERFAVPVVQLLLEPAKPAPLKAAPVA